MYQLRVVRQQAQDLQMGKRDMQKEADGSLETQLPQVAAQRNELVVMHPDGIRGLEDLEQLAGKLRIDGLVSLVLSLLVREPVREIMEQRPQRPIAVTVVISVELRG